jgi:hypothetical protein
MVPSVTTWLLALLAMVSMGHTTAHLETSVLSSAEQPLSENRDLNTVLSPTHIDDELDVSIEGEPRRDARCISDAQQHSTRVLTCQSTCGVPR